MRVPAVVRLAVDDLGAMSQFVDELSVWLSLGRDWISAWHGLGHEQLHTPARPYMRAVLHDRPADGPVLGGGPGCPVVQSIRVVDGTYLRAECATASAGREVPLSHGLLYKARLQVSRRDHRHSENNWCAAAEVALSRLAPAQLRQFGHADNEIKEIRNRASRVIDLYRLAAATTSTLGVSFGQVSAQLAGPRNRATHAGELHDRETAVKASQTTCALVETFEPLPTPEEILAG